MKKKEEDLRGSVAELGAARLREDREHVVGRELLLDTRRYRGAMLIRNSSPL